MKQCLVWMLFYTLAEYLVLQKPRHLILILDVIHFFDEVFQPSISVQRLEYSLLPHPSALL